MTVATDFEVEVVVADVVAAIPECSAASTAVDVDGTLAEGAIVEESAGGIDVVEDIPADVPLHDAVSTPSATHTASVLAHRLMS